MLSETLRTPLAAGLAIQQIGSVTQRSLTRSCATQPALSFLKFDSRQFRNIPARKYLVRGIKVKFHTTAQLTQQRQDESAYSGLFNGTLGAATWTNDPAWLLCIVDGHPLGHWHPWVQLRCLWLLQCKPVLQRLGSDGNGGQEPRFSYQYGYQPARKEVYAAIKELTSLFRGIAYYGAGSLVLNQDKPTDSRYQLVVKCRQWRFCLLGTSLKARHTCTTVAYKL